MVPLVKTHQKSISMGNVCVLEVDTPAANRTVIPAIGMKSDGIGAAGAERVMELKDL